MRKHTLIAIGVAGLLGGIAARAESQVATIETKPVSRIARAVELRQLAVALHSDPARAAEAARLHKQSAQLRAADDPEAVYSLALAAHLFSYGNRPLDARRTMEEAAQRALAMGDITRRHRLTSKRRSSRTDSRTGTTRTVSAARRCS